MMNELIKVTYENDRPTVSARDLHEFLEVETPHLKWFIRMCEYGFMEGKDYSKVMDKIVHNSQGGRPATDYQLTISMAKELCMIQRNEKGKQARQYFIALEEAWNTPEMLMSRALKMADSKIIDLQSEVKLLEAREKENAPKVLFADAVSTAKTSILVGEMAKLLKQNGVDIGQNRLFHWLRCNGFLIKRRGTDYNMPTQRSMELEIFEIKETSISHSDGHITVQKTPKVTGKGQQYFINQFLGMESEA